MSNFRCCMILVCLVYSFFNHANADETKSAAFRNFWHPTYLGERLDYCSSDGKECGKLVADRYCKMFGYNDSSQNEIAHNIGLTHYLLSGQSCKGWHCNGFLTIACVTHLSHVPPKPYHYREKKFIAPRFNDYRINWCYDQKKGCGARAANSFCSRMGFIKAKYFVKEPHVGATKTIGAQELCLGHSCDSFKIIICFR